MDCGEGAALANTLQEHRRIVARNLRPLHDEREEILVGIRAGDSLTATARRLGRAPSTISREVAANG